MIGPDVFSFRALWRSYRTCRRNKRNTLNALAFEIDAEAKLLALQQERRRSWVSNTSSFPGLATH